MIKWVGWVGFPECQCNCIIGTGSHHFSSRAAKLTQGQVLEKPKKRKIGK